MMTSRFPFPQMAIIAREKLSGLGDHWGVLQMDGSVFDITQDKGVRIVPFGEFAAGKQARVIQVIPLAEVHAAYSRIYQEMTNQKPYHLVENNCEIVANRVAGKPAVSPQVLLWTVALLVGGVVFMSSKA
jgi:hypothetical protein